MCIIYVTYIYILIQTIIHITLKILKGTKKNCSRVLFEEDDNSLSFRWYCIWYQSKVIITLYSHIWDFFFFFGQQPHWHLLYHPHDVNAKLYRNVTLDTDNGAGYSLTMILIVRVIIMMSGALLTDVGENKGSIWNSYINVNDKYIYIAFLFRTGGVINDKIICKNNVIIIRIFITITRMNIDYILVR